MFRLVMVLRSLKKLFRWFEIGSYWYEPSVIHTRNPREPATHESELERDGFWHRPPSGYQNSQFQRSLNAGYIHELGAFAAAL